jgi:hypothetical protein
MANRKSAFWSLKFVPFSFLILLSLFHPLYCIQKILKNPLWSLEMNIMLGFASFVTSYLEKSLFENYKYIGLLHTVARFIVVYEYRPCEVTTRLDSTRLDASTTRCDGIYYLPTTTIDDDGSMGCIDIPLDWLLDSLLSRETTISSRLAATLESMMPI